MHCGQEDKQENRIPNHGGLGVAAGKAPPGLVGDRVNQRWARSMNRRLDRGVQQR